MAIDLIDIARPKNNGSFPIVDSRDALGGLMQVADVAARDAVTVERRRDGLEVFVQSTRTTYRLLADLTTWETLTFGGGGGSSINVVAKTADFSVLVGDVETRFTNEGAAGPIVGTLPTAVTPLTYVFAVQTGQFLRIRAAAGNSIRTANLVSALAGYTESNVVGSVIKLTAMNSTEWFAEHIEGAWDTV